jgi:DNA processing protein
MPARLADLPDPPVGLYIDGDIDLLGSPSVAILGSSDAPAARVELARSVAAVTVAADLVVVASGSSAIERAALEEAGVRSVQVVPSLADRARGVGLVVTEGGNVGLRGPGSPGTRGPRIAARLAARRIQVALAGAVVVLASGRESEVMHAAGWARLLDRPLLAVLVAPGEAPSSGPTGAASPASVGADTRVVDDALAGLAELVRTGSAREVRPGDIAEVLREVGAARR